MSENAQPIKIIDYLKSGHSRRVAKRLGNRLGVAPFGIKTPRYSWPILGWMAAGYDGMRGKAVPTYQRVKVLGRAVVVLIGQVWAAGPASRLNAMIETLANRQQKVAVLLACGDPKEQVAPLNKIVERLGRPLKAKRVPSNEVQDTPECHVRVDAFSDALEARVSAE